MMIDKERRRRTESFSPVEMRENINVGLGLCDIWELYRLPDDDEVMIKALKIVVIERNASTSYLQRQLKISYNRAAELLESMEARGIVGPLADNGKREILADIPQKEAENQSK